MSQAEGTVEQGRDDGGNTIIRKHVIAFSRITSESSFGNYKLAERDLEGISLDRKLVLVAPQVDRPRPPRDFGEGNPHQDDAPLSDGVLFLEDRPCYICCERTHQILLLFLDLSSVAGCVPESLSPDWLALRVRRRVPDPFLNGVLHALRGEQEAHGRIDRLYGESLATAVANHCLRNYATTVPPSVIGRSEPGLEKAALHRALAYIDDHLEQDIGLGDIASSVNLSTYHFLRLFKQVVGQTPYQYVLNQRVIKAKLLLRCGRMTMVEIAGAVGFCDQSHFIRHFKKKTGLTPTAFRA